MKTVGVLGGMGPAATADFFTRVVRATPATRDQDHIHLIIDNDPSVPDRSLGIEGSGPSPGPALATMARRLEQAGAEFLVMPCNTAHAFVNDIREATSLPFIDMIEHTVSEACADKPKPVGLLATDGCLAANLYQPRLAQQNCTVVLLSSAEQRELMSLLYRIKNGETGVASQTEMAALAQSLVRAGAQCVVAACTEVPLVLTQNAVSVPLISSTDVLVDRTIAAARGGG